MQTAAHMWNRRTYNEEPSRTGEQPRPEFPAAAPQTPKPMTSTPREAVRSGAVIGSSMTIIGDVHAKEELVIDGELQGKLDSQHRLTVGPNGKVKAGIRAREVVIHGLVQGNVEVVDKIIIHKNGSLVGDIKTAGIVIDDGAYFKGSIDIVKAPPIKAQPEPEAKPAAGRQAPAGH